MLPETSQVTMGETLLLMTMGFIFLVLFESVISLKIFESGKKEQALKIDAISGVLFPFVYFLLSFILVLFYLRN